MKFIITESQNSRIWLLRRYPLVNYAFEETVRYIDPCKFNSYDEYETRFVMYMMDELHPHFYDIEGFDYNGVREALIEMFYVNITESYHNRKC